MLDRAPQLSSAASDACHPVRVCQIAATTQGGDWVFEQQSLLRQHYGYEPSAILNAENGPLVERLQSAGISCTAADFDFASLPNFRDLFTKTWKLARLLRRERFDVVHTTLWHSMLIGRLAGWLADVPVRVTMIAGPFHLEAPITRWMDYETSWMETVLIGSCQYINDLYSELGTNRNKLRLIYFGRDESRFEPKTTPKHDLRSEFMWPKVTPVIAQVAWFYPRVPSDRWSPLTVQGNAVKGHEDLIRATPYILREFPDAKVVFVGGAWLELGQKYMEEMQHLVERLGLQESVKFAGPRSNIPNILKSVDVAVQPSRNECCGGTLESLLMECPTVATRVGGMPDVVIDGQTGVLVNPADPQDLARGICSLLRDREYARTLARAGRSHVLQTATLSRTVADLDKLYRQLLFRSGRKRAGYRIWVSALRLPILIAVCGYLNWRLNVIEYHYRPKWEAGWRPWHLHTLRRLPVSIWNSPKLILLRHRLYCTAVSARGHTISFKQRSICAIYRAIGYGQSYYQRLVCTLYRLLGHSKSLYQRSVCKLYRLLGHSKGLYQRSVCKLYRLLGHSKGLYQRSVCKLYRLLGHSKSLYQRSVCKLYRIVAEVKGTRTNA